MPLQVLDRLLNQSALAYEQPPEIFLAAASACLRVLRAHFPRYEEFLYQRTGQDFERSFSSFEELDRLPALFLPVLKSWQFPVPGDVTIVKRLSSSGTTGQPSLLPLDESSWHRRVQSMLGSYRALGLLEGELTALAFLMDPATTQLAGSLVIDAVLRAVPQVRAIHYLARMGPAGPQFVVQEAAALMAETVSQGPVVLIGYPALIMAAVQALTHAGQKSLPLHAGSRLLTGGGWKSFLPGVRLDQEEFRSQASAFFGIPRPSIRDMFGLSECPAVFVQCEQGRYHIPAWCWAQAIDPETQREAPMDREGLLQLTTPLTTSYPVLRILTTDRVKLGRGCPCGRPARFVTPCGRVTAARFETCAMKIGRAVS